MSDLPKLQAERDGLKMEMAKLEKAPAGDAVAELIYNYVSKDEDPLNNSVTNLWAQKGGPGGEDCSCIVM
jgi:hypothetical protein